MKITLNQLFFALATLSLLAFPSCKKEDTTPPTIVLNGDNPMEIALGSTFSDPGAVATDDTDGTITANIVVDGTVDANTVGSYDLTYTVADAAGNSATATRTVNVVVNITRDDYLGTWNTSNNCATPYSFQATQPTISAEAAADKIKISLFYFNGGELILTVDGTTVTVDAGQAPGPHNASVTGSGTMANDGQTITMDYTFTPNGGTPQNCSTTYTK